MRTLAITLGLLGATAIGVFAAAQAQHRRENCAPPRGLQPRRTTLPKLGKFRRTWRKWKLVGILWILGTFWLIVIGFRARERLLRRLWPRGRRDMAAGAANEARNLRAASRFRSARQGNRLPLRVDGRRSLLGRIRALRLLAQGNRGQARSGRRRNCTRSVCGSSRASSPTTICCVGSAYRPSPSTRSRRVGRGATLRSMAASISPMAATATPNCSNTTPTRRRAFTNSPSCNGFGWSK